MRFLIALILMSLSGIAWGQDPETYFHLGAQTFVTNDVEPAKEIVNQGLSQYPDDPGLLGLKQLLEQQQQQQQDQQQQQQNQDSSEQDQQQSDQNQQQNPSDQNSEQQPPEEEEQAEQEQQPANPEEQEVQPGEEQEQPVEAGEMTEDEAEMLLDALKQREQAEREAMMQRQIQRQSRQTTPVEKDW